jgi:hypothetical protein
MALEYYHDVDLKANQLFNSRLHNITTANRVALGTTLGVGDKGYQVYDVDLFEPYWWDGAAWQTPSGGGAVWGSITGTLTAQTDLTAYLAANYYPLATNPANYIDLTDLSAGTGISYNNLTGVITNSAPDQTVVLNNGTGISISGTYPNFTITNTGLSSIPDLQSVLGVNNAALNQLIKLSETASGYYVEMSSVDSSYPYIKIIDNNTLQMSELREGQLYVADSFTNSAHAVNTTGFQFIDIGPNNTAFIVGGGNINNQTLTIPNTSGTFALSVNGVGAAADGSITIPVGTGTVTGTGTTNYVPKWSSSTALTDSSIFDNGTSVGIGTATPNATYKLHVVGSIATTSGINLDPSVGNKTGLYGGSNQIQFWAGNNQLATYRLNGQLAGSFFEHTAGFTNTGATTGTQNVWRLAGNVTATTAVNTMNTNQLLIDPTYNQQTFGIGTLRGVYYNPTITTLNGSQHTAWENTTGDIIHGNLAGSGTRVVTASSTGTLGTTSVASLAPGFEMNFLLMGA